MRKISKIKKVSLTSRSVDLDFNGNEKQVDNFVYYPKKTLNYIDEKYIPERLYYVDNNLYFYGDGKVCYLDGKKAIPVDTTNFFYEPGIVSIRIKDEQQHIIFDDQVANFIFLNKTYPFSGGEYYAVISNMLLMSLKSL